MRNYQVYYKYEDPYSSEHDYEGAQTVEASSEEAAVSVFREEYPEERYTVQCVFAEVSQ